MAANPGGASPDAFKQQIADEIKKYSEVIKVANLHFEE
jgi:hypothetical protein